MAAQPEIATTGIEEIEIKLLLEGVYLRYGYDFREYALKPSLQERAHRLFYDSLIRSGYLALGQRESLVFCPESSRYQQVWDGVNLFHKVV
jgi:hypothetical protein